MASFLSAASALLTGKTGPLPGFAIGERDAWFEGRTIWSLHSATRRDDGSVCSVLIFDALQPSHNPRRSLLPLAKNALRRLRTTRHPDVVKLLDSAETATAVYVAIESVRPLGKVLDEMRGGSTQQQRDEWVGWGLAKVTNALKFLHVDMAVTHGNVRIDSIFLAASGEWRLGNLELVSKPHEDVTSSAMAGQQQLGMLYTAGGLVPDAARYAPPEVKQQGWGVLRDLDVHVCDSYAFAVVITEAYNGALPPSSTGSVVAAPKQGRIAAPLYSLVKRMMLPNAKSRMSVAALLDAGARPGGFFAENRLYKVAAGLDGFVLASEEDRLSLLRVIKNAADSFPPDFLQYKVLPVLVDAMMLGSNSSNNNNAGSNTPQPQATMSSPSPSLHASRLLPLILQLGQPLADREWTRCVAPTIIKSFTSADRTIRMALLDNLSMYVGRLDAKQTSEKVWPHLLTGFVDTSAAIREATVRSIALISDKLTERIRNNDLLRQLARTQVDSDARIRTNTTILLGTLAPSLTLTTRKKVLVPAFVRSLKDPFVHARVAGLAAFVATSDSFDGEDCARQIIPAMCPCLLDVDGGIREQAKKAVELFLKRVEETAKSMPSPPRETSESIGRESTGAEDDVSSTSRDERIGEITIAGRASLSPSSSSMLAGPSEMDRDPARESRVSTAPWSQRGDLIDVMDDDEDWTGFSSAAPTSKPAVRKAVNLTTASKARKSVSNGRAGSKPAASAAFSGSSANAVHHQNLAMRDAFASDGNGDDDAWGEDAGLSSMGNGKGVQADDALSRDTVAALAAASISPTREPSPATAFTTTAPWEKGGDTWPAADLAKGNGASPLPAVAALSDPSDGSVVAVTREEKRAMLEQQKAARRARMAMLRESKASKMSTDFS